jgi:hypothetical protein
MIGKKINQLATELAPVSTDLTIIGDPISGVSKKITLAQLGAIFSGAVSFYTDLASFPATGDINVIYCAKDTQKLYLWSGSAYVEVFPSQALLDTYQLRSEKGNANGYASLDSGGKVPISQLPSSIMEYKGTWNASTNTPTLANGTGDTGDVYICNVAGTVNFGAGPLTFAVGDYVIYSGTIWQRSSGAVGTVTSVALTVGGDAISVSGSPLTTSGTLALAFSGTTSQYIRGNGTLANFPTSLISGTGNVNAIPKFTDNTVLGNSVMEDDGNFVSMRGLKLNLIAGTGNSINFQQASGIIAAGLGYSSIGAAGSTGIKFYLDQNSTTRSFVLDTTTITSDTERTYSMPNSSGTLALTSDIPSLTGYVPYTGATANVDLGTHTLLAKNLVINHSSGSGVAASITKGGSGEALTVVKSSGSGNAASITGGVTLLSELHLTTDLADAYIASATNWNTAYSLRITSATSPLSITSNVISIAQASGSTNGYLSSTDWTTFNNKQNALTNPVTGTGTTNYLPKFTGASTIGNSLLTDNGTTLSYGNNLVTVGASNTSEKYLQFSFSTGDLYLGGTSAEHYFYGAGAKPINFYTNGTQKMRLDASGNLGLGVTPSAWSLLTALQISGGAILAGYGGATYLGQNFYYGSGGDTYISNGYSTRYTQFNGQHLFFTAPSGTAGNAISFTQAMTLNASGNLSLGNTNDTYKLDVTGTGRFTGTLTAATLTDGFITIGAAQINRTSATVEMQFAGSGDVRFFGNTAYPITFTTGTGAATFSSSVTAGGLLTTAYTSTGSSMGHFIVNTAASTLSNSADIWFGTWGGSTISGITNARISALNVNAGNAATDLLFYTWNGSSSGERFRIASSGAATFSSSVDIGQSATVRGFTGTTGAGMFMAYGSAGAGIGSIYSYNYGTSTYGGTVIDGSYVAFYNSGSEKMRVTGGNVGIGTTSPSGKFQVVLPAYLSEDTDSQQAIFGSGTSGYGVRIGYNESNNIGYINSLKPGVAWSNLQIQANNIIFAPVATERMRITSAGSVGIGTTSPANRLQVNVSSNDTGGFIDASYPLYLRNTSTTANSYVGIYFGGGFGVGATIETQFVSPSTSDEGILKFATRNSSGSIAERMRITSGGSVLIGTTTEGFLGKLQVAGSVAITGQYNTVLPSSSFSYFDGSGQVVSSASSASALYLDTTWNTTGNPDGIYLNVTNTASGASSKLLNLKVGNASQFSVSKAGAIQTTAPSSGSAQPWKLGSYAAGGTGTATGVIYIEVNGQIYSIPALQGTP